MERLSYPLDDTPPVVDLRLYAGQTPTVGFILPADLTGCRVSLQARVLGSAELELTNTQGLSVTPNDPVAGRSTVKLTELGAGGYTLARSDQRADWDLQVEFPDGSKRTYLRGVLEVVEGRRP